MRRVHNRDCQLKKESPSFSDFWRRSGGGGRRRERDQEAAAERRVGRESLLAPRAARPMDLGRSLASTHERGRRDANVVGKCGKECPPHSEKTRKDTSPQKSFIIVYYCMISSSLTDLRTRPSLSPSPVFRENTR